LTEDYLQEAKQKYEEANEYHQSTMELHDKYQTKTKALDKREASIITKESKLNDRQDALDLREDDLSYRERSLKAERDTVNATMDDADRRLLEIKRMQQQCFDVFKQLRTLEFIDNMFKAEENKKRRPLSLLELATVLVTGTPVMKQEFKERSVKEMDKHYASKIQLPPKKTDDGYGY